MQPYEIVAAPLTVYVAPVATAFPAVDAAPAAAWFRLGTSGDKNYNDDGVSVSHNQTLQSFRGAGSTQQRKAWRTEEDIVVALTLVDISAEQYAKILDDAGVTTTAPAIGVAGTDRFGLVRGVNVGQFALLARGLSPANEDLAAQYQVPRCYQSGSQTVQFGKSNPTGLALEFTTLESDDPTELVIQTAIAG